MRRPTARTTAAFLAAWIPALLLTRVFTAQGLAKFSDDSGWAAAFRHWGYPDWFRMLVGATELVAVACLLSGRLAALGALLVCAVMLGGMGTHIVFDHGRHLTSEVGPLVLAAVVLVVRRRQLAALAAWLRGRSGRPTAVLAPRE